MRCIFALVSVFATSYGSVQTVTTDESFDASSTCGTDVFEGVEKRFELLFAVEESDHLGVRAISRTGWNAVCAFANCVIIHHEHKPEFDSYILSESSLFVFRDRVMMKTCGTTIPLSSADHIVRFALSKHIPLVGMIYSRSSFLYQHLQNYPHQDDREEIEYLDAVLLAGHKPIASSTFILGNPNDRYWLVHQKVFMESSFGHVMQHKRVVVDCIMSDMPHEVCDRFYRNEELSVAENEVVMSNYVSHVLPDFKQICAKSFDKCGYSCNAHDPIRDLAGDRYFTIHITPEQIFSYASVEAIFYIDDGHASVDDIKQFISRVAGTFEPSSLSVAIIAAPGVEFNSDNMDLKFEAKMSDSNTAIYSRADTNEEGIIESEPLLCGYQGSYVSYNLVNQGITV